VLTCVGSWPASRDRADGGFVMVEALVAIAVVSIVMLSLTSFFVITTRITSEQGDRQSGIQAADDAMERAKGLQGGAILTGRDQTSSTTQWTTNVPSAAQDLLGTTTMAYDTGAAAGAGATAALPTTYRAVTLNGVQYRQYWYIGACQRATGATGCLATSLTSGFTAFYRVIVAVTWAGRSCAGGTCVFVTSSLIGSNTSEPIFNTGTPALTTPSTQTNDQSVALSFTVDESGGATPLTWAASSLPTGLAIDTSSGEISGTPTATGAFSPTVNVTDAYGVQDSVTFSWVIKALPAMTAPGTVSSPGGVAFSKTFVVGNGTSPYTWGASGLPPGLSLIANPLYYTNNDLGFWMPNQPDGSQVYKYTATQGYEVSTFDGIAGQWSNPTLQVEIGTGFFFRNTSQTALTFTFVGEVPQGWLTNSLPEGFSTKGSLVPASQTLSWHQIPGEIGDEIRTYTNDLQGGGSYNISVYTADGWTPDLTLNIGQGFWIYKQNAQDWVRYFTVN